MIKCLCLNLRKPKMYFSPVILLFRSHLLLKCCLFLTHLSGDCGTLNVMDQYSKQWSPTDISNVFTSSSGSLFENRSSRFPFTHNNKHKLNEDSEKHFSSLSLPAFSLSTTRPQMLSLTPASSESIRRNTQANYLAEKLCESAFSSVCVFNFTSVFGWRPFYISSTQRKAERKREMNRCHPKTSHCCRHVTWHLLHQQEEPWAFM